MIREGKEPYFLNIAPLLPGHEEETAADIADLAERGVITHNAFCCTLTPEGNPMFDKASELGKRFTAHYAALRKRSDVPCGILIQATIGHGWTPNVPSHGQKFIQQDGQERYIFCPLGGEFREYIGGQVRKLASCKPDFFMLDDDFRMLSGRGGCFCPLHIEGFRRLTGKEYTPESIRDAISRDETVARAYDAWLQQTMEEVARIIRDAIDRETPGLPCSFCMVSDDIRHAAKTGRILQGNGPLRIRINNGYYLAESVRGLPYQRLRSAHQSLYLPEGTELLDEPDTCPHNRYSTSAAMLHNHMARAMIAGYSGAKIWITRLPVYEPESGRAYREILKKNAGFYRTLFHLGLKEDGILIPLPSESPFNFPWRSCLMQQLYPLGNWLTQTSVMGFPFRIGLSTAETSVSALAGNDCDLLSDSEIRNLLSGDLILDGEAARKLTQRNFGAELGLTASEWGDLPSPSFEEKEDGSGRIVLSSDNSPALLTIHEGVRGEVLTWISHRESALSSESQRVAPGVIRLVRPDGHSLFVMAVSLKPYGFAAFSYLNETRKAQFAEFWKEKIAMYYDGDAELMTQTGRDAEGNRIAILQALSADDVERPRLVFRKSVRSMERLSPDGVWVPLPFAEDGAAVRPELTVRMLYPEVLRIAEESEKTEGSAHF